MLAAQPAQVMPPTSSVTIRWSERAASAPLPGSDRSSRTSQGPPIARPSTNTASATPLRTLFFMAGGRIAQGRELVFANGRGLGSGVHDSTPDVRGRCAPPRPRHRSLAGLYDEEVRAAVAFSCRQRRASRFDRPRRFDPGAAATGPLRALGGDVGGRTAGVARLAGR